MTLKWHGFGLHLVDYLTPLALTFLLLNDQAITVDFDGESVFKSE
jgi:hypothetical protein